MPPRSLKRDESSIALGRAVHELRREKKITQEELALRAGFHETYISIIESGRRNPTWDAVRKISRGLGLPLYRLARRVEQIERDEPTR